MRQNTSRQKEKAQDSAESCFTLDHVETVSGVDNAPKENRIGSVYQAIMLALVS